MAEEKVQTQVVESDKTESQDDGSLFLDAGVIERKVKIKGNDNIVRDYVLRELMGPDRDRYLNSLSNRMKLDSNGKPVGFKTFDGMQADLIHRCLWDTFNKQVPMSVINTFPARIQQALFKEAQKMSSLDDGAEERAKND